MASLMNLFARTHGLIKIRPTVRVTDNYTLSLVYTPGVGHVCKVIEKDPDLLYDLCITGRSIALITDGSGFYSKIFFFSLKVMNIMIQMS